MAKSFSGSQRSSVAKPFSSRNPIAVDRVSLGARKQGRGPGGIRGRVAFRPGQGRCFEALVRPTRALTPTRRKIMIRWFGKFRWGLLVGVALLLLIGGIVWRALHNDRQSRPS